MDRVGKKFQYARLLKSLGWGNKEAVEKAIKAVDRHPTAEQIKMVRNWYRKRRVKKTKAAGIIIF